MITILRTRFIPTLLHSRSYADFSRVEIENAKNWLEKFTPSQIPANIFTVAFSRSSGAGGQKVNKTSSKATVSLEPHQWLNPQYCYWIPKPILSQISQSKVRYETKSGGILIQSDHTRNRDTNTEECFKKLLNEIKAKTFFEGEVSEDNKQKWVEVKEVSKERRLFHKKIQGEKKKLRSKKFDL